GGSGAAVRAVVGRGGGGPATAITTLIQILGMGGNDELIWSRSPNLPRALIDGGAGEGEGQQVVQLVGQAGALADDGLQPPGDPSQVSRRPAVEHLLQAHPRVVDVVAGRSNRRGASFRRPGHRRRCREVGADAARAGRYIQALARPPVRRKESPCPRPSPVVPPCASPARARAATSRSRTSVPPKSVPTCGARASSP